MKDQDILEQLADSLADDLVIDWQLATTIDDQSQQVIKNLAVLGQIAQLQGQTQSFTDGSESETNGFRWGHLQVGELLGSGVYGEVYRAHDDVLDRQVALKLLKPEIKSAVESMRFIEEAKRMARVRHPHVLAIHGADVHAGRSGFWADLIEGETLDQLPANRSLDEPQLLLMCDQLSAGLEAIHQAGIIHGDIKPANLIRDEHGNHLIMDFGAGDVVDEQTGPMPAFQGTPLLMAPELILNQISGPAADVYALGATLFKSATGEYPVPGQTLEEIRQKHQVGQTRRLQTERPDLDKALCALVDHMLQADPEQRPTARQVQQELRILEQLPQRRRDRRAAITIIGVLVLGLLFSGWGFYRAEQQKDQALIARNQAEAISDFLQDMLNASSELGRGRDVTVADMLDIASPEVDQKFADQPEVAAALHHALANSYNALRDTEKSLQHASSGLALKHSYLSAADPELLKTRLEEIQSYQLSGAHERSLELINDYLQVAVPALGDDNRYVQLARKHQVNNLFSLSRYQEANAILDQYFTEVEDPATASNNFGYEILQAKANGRFVLGEFEAGLDYTQQAMDWLAAYPNKSPINEASIRSVRALALLESGDPDAAVATFHEVMALTERVFGKDNQEYLEVLNNLSTAQKAQGRIQAAMETNQQAYALAQQIYGDDVNQTMIALAANLANFQVELGDLTTGEATMREALTMSTDHLGDVHVETLKLEYNLAELMNKQGRHALAEELAASTYARKKATLGEAHPYTILSLDNWAISLAGQGRFAEALSHHAAVVSGLTAAIGADHPYTWLVMKHQVQSLEAAGQIEQAAIKLQVLLEQQQAKLPADDAELISHQQWLVSLQQQLN